MTCIKSCLNREATDDIRALMQKVISLANMPPHTNFILCTIEYMRKMYSVCVTIMQKLILSYLSVSRFKCCCDLEIRSSCTNIKFRCISMDFQTIRKWQRLTSLTCMIIKWSFAFSGHWTLSLIHI